MSATDLVTPEGAYDRAIPDITVRIAAELIAHEGIVREAYRDSVGVWTWSVGLTDASGHSVSRYRDAPQPLAHCLAIYIWALRRNYLPPVLAAFGDHRPEEHELAAALSFHWNTGGIARAQWMKLAMEGKTERARAAMLNWARPASLLPRRRREQALFFDGEWTGDGEALVYEVAKPSYRPTAGRRLPIGDTLAVLLGEARAEDEETPASSPGADMLSLEDDGATCSSVVDKRWFARLLGGS